MVKKISTLAYKSTTLGCKIVATLHRIRNSNTLIKIKKSFYQICQFTEQSTVNYSRFPKLAMQ